MNVLPIIKGVASMATSIGAGAVVGNAIKMTTPPGLRLFQKVFVGIGGVVLSTAAGDIAARYVEDQIQGIADTLFAGKKLAEAFSEGFAEAVVPPAQD